jgi:positive regulator of sigma E activity
VRETARILSIDGNTATLSCAENLGCDHCAGTFCNVKARTYRARLPADLKAAAGDRVEVFIPPAKAITAGFWVLILPLLAFLAGYFALLPVHSEPLRVAAGAGGLMLGFGFVAWRSRRLPGQLPQVVSVVADHSGQ